MTEPHCRYCESTGPLLDQVWLDTWPGLVELKDETGRTFYVCSNKFVCTYGAKAWDTEGSQERAFKLLRKVR